MPSALRSRLASLADSFASAVLDAVRSTPLEGLLFETGGRPASGRTSAAAPKRAPKAARGRLKRRSAGDIAKALGEVVALVKGHKDGMRAEQIRAQLHMQSKEMPRVLAEGLANKKLKKKGQKRATTYFAA
jgi:hypothetical protein